MTTGKSAASLISNKKAVIFDLFHTLVSLRWAWGNRLPMTHEVLGVSRAAWSAQLQQHLQGLYLGREMDPFTAIARMARAINPAILDTVIRTATDAIVDAFAGALIRVPEETMQVLGELKSQGKKIGLVSNATAMEMTAWHRSPLAPFFESAIFSCDVGCVKPEPLIYIKCLRQLGVTATETVFVGDGASDELKGARDLGMTTIMRAGFIREERPECIEERQEQADFMIETLAELIADVTVGRKLCP